MTLLHLIRRCILVLISAIVAYQFSAPLVSPAMAAELMGYWKLDETSIDDDVIDSSGNGLTGTFEGDVEPNVEGAPGFGSAVQFDGVTGQNALSQAKEFNAAIPLTGLIVTKLDGTPKGGIIVAIESELGIPVRYIGVGEGEHDLRPFDAAEFAEALFDRSAAEKTFEGSFVHAETRRRRREDGPTVML